jgi:hypothetical protein
MAHFGLNISASVVRANAWSECPEERSLHDARALPQPQDMEFKFFGMSSIQTDPMAVSLITPSGTRTCDSYDALASFQLPSRPFWGNLAPGPPYELLYIR